MLECLASPECPRGASSNADAHLQQSLRRLTFDLAPLDAV